MKRDLIHGAKPLIPQIVEYSKRTAKGQILLAREVTPGNVFIHHIFTSQIYVWPECMNFGSKPLKPMQVKQIIEDYEYLNYLIS